MAKTLPPILRILVATTLLLAALAAASALLLRQPVADAELLLRSAADPERLRADVHYLAGTLGPRDVAHPENLDLAAQYIAEQFRAAGVAPTFEPYTARGGRYRNVIGRLGSCASPLVVGAHYDSFGEFGPNPGADDNASGVAGVLELARLLAPSSPTPCVDLVAFSTEEPPFFGSAQMGSTVYLSRLLAAGRSPRGMLSLEMIGFYSAAQPWPSLLLSLLYPNQGDFAMLIGRWQDRELLAAFKPGLQRASAVRVVSYSGPFIAGMDASDHLSFWSRGFPALMLTDTAFLRNHHYHSPDDTPESLDYAKMADLVEGVANALLTFDALE